MGRLSSPLDRPCFQPACAAKGLLDYVRKSTAFVIYVRSLIPLLSCYRVVGILKVLQRGTFSFSLKTQLKFVIFKYILFDCFRFQFI